ncbi:multiheme c-type cytochrome [Desulfovibrio inopinatus]|uniref:multiheme c-type cytochrome n=1 Tax=Desulfovibrio inopinatus TaxID=102109 RepID=UPI00041F7240|nr:multiheme c-type cytochrome [Desulfovibrio inopinatus]
MTAFRLFVLSCLATTVCFAVPLPSQAEEPEVSDDTSTCLSCHETVHPGIVEDWKQSRHAKTTVAEALKVEKTSRKVSSTDIPENLRNVPIGCAECHMVRGDAHKDSFEHNGYTIHIAVSPDDCAVCHSEEATQYKDNLMSHAYGNMADNALYKTLMDSMNGTLVAAHGGELSLKAPNLKTENESCYSCHGTKLAVTSTTTRDTDFGEMEFPVIQGWPNVGVGRVNLDGSLGSCSACHSRHAFSMATARKPYTCKQCHDGPDVPAYKVYGVSRHGKIFSSSGSSWNYNAVPWTVGTDFTTPTCAACHVSLLSMPDGTVLTERTHAMSPRLPWRIFGLPYAHPQPKSPDTSIIRNANDVPFPVTLTGEPASSFLIDTAEQAARQKEMTAVCKGCHDTSWINGFWPRFDNTIATTNAATKTATDLLMMAWNNNLAAEPTDMKTGTGLFDNYVENVWSTIWLIHSNKIRFASAMSFGGDYGVFAGGRYELNMRLREMSDWIERGMAQEKK